ncbi:MULTISPECIES: transporter substrate-binding domain-containing protein [unclassified Variovorax]|uniref:transporter substrate-binding domain-containing protein n=1 Tax=unclassified Variovorax TaxID=663243 RepID=UPI003F48617B
MPAHWIRKLALIGAMAIGTGAVYAQSVDDIVKAGTLKVGMLVDLPPFGVMKTNGEAEGLDADFARLMGKYLGVKVEIVPVTGAKHHELISASSSRALRVTPTRSSSSSSLRHPAGASMKACITLKSGNRAATAASA